MKEVTDSKIATKILEKLYRLNFPEPIVFRPAHSELVIVMEGLREYARSETVCYLYYLIDHLEGTDE